MKYIALKLITGEEVIATVITSDATTFTLTDCRVLVADHKGELRLEHPILFTAEPNKDLVVQKTSVSIWTPDVRNELLDSYKTAISGIITPPSNRILLG